MGEEGTGVLKRPANAYSQRTPRQPARRSNGVWERGIIENTIHGQEVKVLALVSLLIQAGIIFQGLFHEKKTVLCRSAAT